MSKCKLCQNLLVDERFEDKGLCWVCYAHCMATRIHDRTHPEIYARVCKKTGITVVYDLTSLTVSDYVKDPEGGGMIISICTRYTPAHK